MKSLFLSLSAVIFVAVFSAFIVPQEKVLDVLKDPRNQDEIIAFISSNHAIVMKLLDRLESHEHFRAVLGERLKKYEAADGRSAYVGFETRQIKAYSDAEIQSLIKGEGMGFAMAAELNSYPGPLHVLEAADQLALTNNARQRVGVIFDTMHAETVRLGKLIVEQERSLDRLFASRKIQPASLKEAVASIARLQGELRSAHLLAHLETNNQLSATQRVSYNQIRGYSLK